MIRAYYNEIDPYAAEWLRNLVAKGLIAPGDVDTRSIVDVRPDDLRPYTQCHFFAGIGVWSYALRLAGWDDSRPVWTGSCPCQPFSAAGKGEGFDDERHLWPHWHHLIRECRPPTVFGEQVASKDGLGWLDLVQADLEGEGYAVGAADLCAAGVGAPHIRQRLWFVADAHAKRLRTQGSSRPEYANAQQCGGISWLAHAGSNGDRQHARKLHGDEGQHEIRPAHGDYASVSGRAVSGLADAHSERFDGQHARLREGSRGRNAGAVLETAGGSEAHRCGQPGPTNGFWRDADWLYCRDGKWRPVESGTFPLAHGAPARVGRLRAYGNAINPYPAKAVIESYLDAEHLRLTAVSDLSADSDEGIFA